MARETIEENDATTEELLAVQPAATALAVVPGAALPGLLPEATPPAPLPEIVTCANCTTLLAGPYCSQCGQHVADYHRSLLRLVAEMFDNLFCWDNKWLRTLGPLLARPGFLTLEFMAGRRVRYVLPLRLFLFTSAVCLALLQFEFSHSTKAAHHSAKESQEIREMLARMEKGDYSDGKENKPSPGPSVAPAAVAVATPARQRGTRDDNADDDDRAPPKSPAAPAPSPTPATAAAAVAAKPGEPPGPPKADPDSRRELLESTGKKLSHHVAERIARAGIDGFGQEVVQGIEQRMSWAALAVLPLFAVLLRSVYWREDSLYFAHLIFSLHYHTFLLLFWTVHSYLDALGAYVGFFPLHFALAVSWLLPPVYLYAALRQIYRESPRRTVFKVGLIGTAHLVLLITALAITGTLSVMG